MADGRILYVVSLVNSARYVQNKSSIGFLNPTLYAYSKYFTDVKKGKNNCCAYTGLDYANATCCKAGFNATTGKEK
jgi:hypothetical protein